MALFLIFIIVFAFKLLIIINSSLTFFSDDAIYASLAQRFLEDGWQKIFHPTWPPLFPFLSAIAYKIYPRWETALRVVSAISGTVLLIPLFYLTKNVLSKIHAVFLIIVLSLLHPVFYASISPLSDALSSTLIVSSIVSFFFGIRFWETKFFILASFLFGLAFLTRSEGTMFFFLSLAYLTFYLVLQLIRRKKQFIKYFLIIPICIAIFFLTASPYIIATKKQLGEWTLSAKFSAQIQQGYAFALRENGTTWSQEVVSVKSPNYKSEYFRNGTLFILEHEDYFRWWFIQKLGKWKDVFPVIFPLWSSMIMAIGIISVFWRKFPSSHLYIIFVMFLAIPVTIFSTTISDVRYLLWTIPLFLYFFYLGMDTLLNIGRFIFHINIEGLVFYISKGWVHHFFVFVAFFLSLTFPAISYSLISNPIGYAQEFTEQYFRPVFIETANWIKSSFHGENPRIMMRHEMLEFYANGETIYLPQNLSIEELIKYAKKYKVNYLVAREAELAGDEKLLELFRADINLKKIKRVYSRETPEGKLFIYILLD